MHSPRKERIHNRADVTSVLEGFLLFFQFDFLLKNRTFKTKTIQKDFLPPPRPKKTKSKEIICRFFNNLWFCFLFWFQFLVVLNLNILSRYFLYCYLFIFHSLWFLSSVCQIHVALCFNCFHLWRNFAFSHGWKRSDFPTVTNRRQCFKNVI